MSSALRPLPVIRSLFAAAGLLSSPSLASGETIALTRHAPEIMGRVEGSLQQMLAETSSLSGGGTITGDWLVPGSPDLKLNGHPTFGGESPATGSTTPRGWKLTLSGSAQLGGLVTRTDAITLPTVPAVENSTGTLAVTIHTSAPPAPDWSQVRDLTLSGSSAAIAMPPGVYRNVNVSAGVLTLGDTGAAAASLYQLQSLQLSGNARIELSGPVVLRVQNPINIGGSCGTEVHPDWLRAEVKSGGLSLLGGSRLYGTVVAPAGTVTLNGNSLLDGNSVSDRLTVQGSGILRIRQGGTGNQPPVALPQSVTTLEDSPAGILLTGTDPENSPLAFTITAPPAHGALSGTPPALTYSPAAGYSGPDSFSFTAADGTLVSPAAVVAITVTPVNDAPIAIPQAVSAQEDQDQPVSLQASDQEGDALSWQVLTRPLHGVLIGTAPDLTYSPNQNYNGPDSFTFAVSDGLTVSETATVTITVTPVNDAPVAANGTVETPEDTAVPVVLSGTDIDGDTLTWQIVAVPLHGSVSGTAPELTYTPDPDFHGSDSLTVRASDGTADSGPAVISITVTPINDAPAAVPQSLATGEDLAASLNLTTLAEDIDDAPASLTFTILAPQLRI